MEDVYLGLFILLILSLKARYTVSTEIRHTLKNLKVA